MANVKVKGSAKIFNNKALELLTKTHPIVILGIYIPFCAYLLWYFYNYIEPSVPVLIGVFAAGFFSWTFFEYILHRYVFHFVDERQWTQKFHFFVHGVHHEYPKDKQRLVMPPIPSLVVCTVFFVLFRLFLGTYVFAFFSGFIIGYLTYAMMHYSMHAFRIPKKGVLRFLWEYHNIHHYKYPDKAFGVSSPFWDVIFRTYPPKDLHKKKVAAVVDAK